MSNKHENVKSMKISVSPIKAFNDNYIWAITAENCRQLVLVDPGTAEPCIEYMEQHHLSLSAILITHHHADHTGGIKALQEYCALKNVDITVYGPASEAISGLDVKLIESDTVNLNFHTPDHSATKKLALKVLDVPGHTAGHIAYHNDDILFCGDTLFSGGCGRLFEGTPEQMHISLNKLKALPGHTKVYCTHEYTLANLHFAVAVEPSNPALLDYLKVVKDKREHNQITLPSTIANEININPFLRSNNSNVVNSVCGYTKRNITSEVETFAALRSWKDNF